MDDYSPNSVTTSHSRPTNSNASMIKPRMPPIRASGRVKMSQSQASMLSNTGPKNLITTTTTRIIRIMERSINYSSALLNVKPSNHSLTFSAFQKRPPPVKEQVSFGYIIYVWWSLNFT